VALCYICEPHRICEAGEARHFKFSRHIDGGKYASTEIDYPQKIIYQLGHMTSSSFGKCNNISEMVQDGDIGLVIMEN